MRLVERSHQKGEVDLPLVFSAVVLAGGALAAAWTEWGPGFPPCAFKAATGFACPSCGGTRMGEALLHGRILEAFLWNPLLFLGLAGILGSGLVCLVRRLMGLPRLRIRVDSGRERAFLRTGAVLVLTLGWIYLVLRGV